MKPAVFPRERDRFFWSVAITEPVLGVPLLLAGEPFRWMGLAAIAVGSIMTWWARSSFYVIDDANLIVRSGPLRWTTTLSEIDNIEPEKGYPWLAVVSSSVDLVCFWWVYPADKDGFLKAIAARSPELEFDGHAVKRPQLSYSQMLPDDSRP